jgi:hypothetical protein
MRPLPCILLLACAAAGSAGRAAEPLDSGACHDALQALQAHQQASRAQSDKALPDARAEALRSQAARTCLGGDGKPPPPGQHVMQAPISVRPIAALRAPAPRPAHPSVPAALSSGVAPSTAPAAAPAALTGCDSSGCWSADGVRLRRDGPFLVGPQGLCHAQGTQLVCP